MITAVLFSMFSCHSIYGQSITGREIMQKVKDRPDGDTRYSEMTMRLVNKRNRERVRKLKSYAFDIKKDVKKIMFFQYPGDVKGTGFLTWDYDEIGKDDDKWLYLPAMKKTRRISGSSAKTDYFMGSDFTYDDMGSRAVDEDTHTLLKEVELEGHKCWIVESVSKDTRDIYLKKVSWIRKDCLVAMKVEYYDKMNKLHRKLTLTDIEKVDGFWMAKKLHIINVQTNHQTYLTIENPKYDIDIEEDVFVVSNLEKGDI